MFLYRVLSVLALLIYSPYALVRSVAGRRRLGDIRGRLGLAPYPDLGGGIWVHAVSVGEVSVARNLLAALSRRAPGTRLGLSVTTAAGLEAARSLTAQGIAVFSFPLDLAGPVEKALSAARPGLILLTETELWPLLLDRARAAGVPVALVNGRISDRSFRRYLLLRGWFRRVLENISLFAMQTDEDARRIERLGARPERILVTGNIKYDLASAPPFADAARLSTAAAGRPILIAASTGEGEEQMVLEAWKGLDPRPLLVLAPRRPERFDTVAALVENSGFRLVRRSETTAGMASHKSQLTTHNSPTDIYLLDSIGELPSVYGEASLAFLGGSLTATGGHNPIEAWAQGVTVLVGPHTGNFREITQAGQRLGILESVADARELSRAFDLALKDRAGTAARGDHARRFVAESRGAAASTADSVARLLPPGRNLSGAPCGPPNSRRERAAAP
jgi:3-deoxy-D-manno-octulosonic-acid transferase